MRSISSISRARTSERGVVLLAALVLAILYFALMELLLIDSSRELQEAQRFKSRVVAAAFAENGAELAALQVRSRPGTTVMMDTPAGSVRALRRDRAGSGAIRTFNITADAETKGVMPQKASVKIEGEIDVNTGKISIRRAVHSQ